MNKNKMLKIFIWIILIIPVKVFSISSAESFYLDLINSVKNAKGTLDVYISAGNWTSTVRGAQVIWYNEQETRVTFEFDYRGGSLNPGSQIKVSFSPAINVWVNHGTRGLSYTIKSITYDDRGNKLTWDAKFNNLRDGARRAPTDPREDGVMTEAVGIYPQPNRLFKGELFRNFFNSRPVGKDLQPLPASQPFITRVALVQQGAKPGLYVELKENSVIYFSHNINSNTSDNFLNLGPNCHVIFDYVTYDCYSKELEGSLKDFNVVINNGAIKIKPNIDLELQAQSSIVFDNVYFKKDEHNIAVDCSGTIKGNLQAGSRINITTKIDNPSWIVFDDNSSVTLQKISFNIQDKKVSKITIGGGSSLDMAIRDAQIGIGNKGFIDFGTGRIIAILSGDWSTERDEQPDATIKFTNIDAPISGGKLYPNNNSELLIESGNFKSTDLTLVGYHGLTGRITQMDLFFRENSKIGIPNGFELITSPGSSAIAATPTEPMILSDDSKFPIATYAFTLNFHKFSSSRNPIFGLGEGNGKFNIKHKVNEDIDVDNSHLIAAFTFKNGQSELTGKCSITSIRGTESGGNPEHIEGDLQLNINSGFKYNIHSSPERQAGHDNLRIFPVDVNFSIDQPIQSTIGKILIDGQKVNISKVSFAPQLTVNIPPGGGEHDNPDDDNSANGTKGPDEHGDKNINLRQAQELFTDTYATCRLHIYLLAHTYLFASEFYFQMENNVLSISLTNLKCNEPFSEDVAWSKDGCNDLAKIVGTIAGIIGGSILGGPVGGVVGGIVGYKVTDDLIDNLSYKLSAIIAEKIESQKLNWSIKV